MATLMDISGTLSNHFTLNNKATILQGNGAPSTNTGKIGDLYFDNTNGKLYIKESGNEWSLNITESKLNDLELNSLSDVSITNVSNGQGLLYNSTTEQWENQEIGSGSVAIDNNTITKNASEQLQTNGILNKRNTTSLNVWEGTYSDWVSGGTEIPYYNWKSNEPSTWTYKDITFKSDANIKQMVYGNGKYLLREGYYSDCYISSDLDTFTSLGFTANLLYFDGNNYFAIQSGNTTVTIKISTDGTNWTDIVVSDFSSWLPTDMIYANNMYIIVGYGTIRAGNNYIYSYDGTNWQIGNFTSGACKSITYGNGKFAAVSNDTSCRYSTDGINWLTSEVGYSSVNKYIAFGNGKFVVKPYQGGKCLYSTDAITWTTQSFSSDSYWYQIIYANGLFVTTGLTGRIAYSSDAITWTEVANGSWNGTVFNGSEYVTYYQKFGISTIVKAVYTLTTTPTTSTTVYNAPGSESSLTITSVSDNALVLSDTITYNRNSSGDLSVLGTVGDSYPNYLCFVDNKNVIKGNTVIAQIAPTKISDLEDDTAIYPIDKADTLTGLTATTTELNVLDGIEASTTELNYVKGTTSSIQNQIGYLNDFVAQSIQNLLSAIAEKEDIFRLSTLPTASSTYNNMIVQYIGDTTTSYTNGYFYKCNYVTVKEPVEESMVATQTAGEPLGTITTNLSVFKAALNPTETQTYTFKSLGYPKEVNLSKTDPEIQILTLTRDTIYDKSTINQYGWKDESNNYYYTDTKTPKSTTRFYLASSTDPSEATETDSGYDYQTTSERYDTGFGIWYLDPIDEAIELSTYGIYVAATSIVGDEIEANYTKASEGEYRYEWQQLNVQTGSTTTISSTTATLTSSGWTDNTQTVTVSGVTATNTIWASPAPTSTTDYVNSGILCTTQASNSLTFTCTTTPTTDITVNIIIGG